MQNQDVVQLVLFSVLISSIWFCELFFNTLTLNEKWKHSKVNLLFIATALPIQLLMVSIVLIISLLVNKHHWGLIYFIPYHSNKIVYYVSLFILLDFCEYVYHVIMHKTKLLWRFHLVHHADHHVDVSTTVREHPVETLVRTSFLMLWVFLLGPTAMVLLLRQTLQTISNISSHSQFRLPEKLNKIIGYIFITPNLHHVHHHYQLPHTDRNYGDVLSIWDHIFGTFGELCKEETVFGLDTHMINNHNCNFINCLKMPFKNSKHQG